MSTLRQAAAQRCGPCRQHHQKECVFTRQSNTCDRCSERGYECTVPLPQPRRSPSPKASPEHRRAPQNRFKCDHCRRSHQTCRPVGRVWPQKCERCRLRGNPCSVPRSKKEFESFRASQQRARTVASKTENQHQHQHQHIRDVLMPIPNSSSDSDSSDSDASIPAVLPRKRKWESKGEESGSGMVEQLKGMIRTMEDEFKDVLRAEHDKHAREIQELRDKHQEELTQQREKYESRIDDLIKIMKKIG